MQLDMNFALNVIKTRHKKKSIKINVAPKHPPYTMRRNKNLF